MEAIRDLVTTHYPRVSSLATAVITGVALVGVVVVDLLAVRGAFTSRTVTLNTTLNRDLRLGVSYSLP